MKIPIILISFVCLAGRLQGEEYEDADTSESITEQIDRINTGDGAPKCLEEGDIMGDNCDGSASKRNAVRKREKLWHTRIVPYYIDESLGKRARKVIADTIRDYHKYTCIRLVKSSSKSKIHKIKFFKGKGCYSKIGKTSGIEQPISIGSGCTRKGTVIHEIMHALGFWHEQSRYDRDKFITIHWDNIKPKKRGNFNKKDIKDSTTLGQPYDYDGVMHYGRKAFAIDKAKDTITPKKHGVHIGQREGFSHTDLAQLNSLYDCESSQKKGWSQWSSWSSCIRFGWLRLREQRQRFCMLANAHKCEGSGGQRVEKRQRFCGAGKTGLRRAIVCQGHSGKIRCPNHYRLYIERANYGRTSRYVCNGKGRWIFSTNCRSNVRINVSRKCNDRRSCTLHTRYWPYGWRCLFTYKYLDVKYRCLRKRG